MSHRDSGFVRDTTAATMIEYGALLALIALVALAGVELLGIMVSALFEALAWPEMP